MLVADGGWGMLPIILYARTKWLTKLAVFTYPHGEQSIGEKSCKGAANAKSRMETTRPDARSFRANARQDAGLPCAHGLPNNSGMETSRPDGRPNGRAEKRA